MSVERRRKAVRQKRAGGRIPLRAYVAGLVVLFMAVAAVNVVYQRQASLRNARQSALAGAGYAAQVAADQIGATLTTARAEVAAVATQPTIRQAFGPAGATGCALQFGGAAEFSTGHINIVRADGAVVCSSLPPRRSPGYAGAKWLAAALKGPVLSAPTADARTGQQTVVIAAPVPGKGAVAVFLNLAPLGPTLATELGGASSREFVVTTTTTAGAVVLARSIQPGAWAGKPVAGTPFAGAAGQADHRDLNGTPRLYGQAVVPGIGWRVFAGAGAAATYAAASALSDRQILITLIGLAVLFAAALVLYRRVARPIAVLAAGVRAATAHLPAGPVPVAGPAEVAALAGDVNQLIAAAGRELEASSQLAAVAESSADAILGMTPDGVITSWNAGAEQIFGYTRQEMTGTGLAVLVGPGRAGGLPALLERVGGGETVTQAETKARRKDGTLIDVTYTMSPLRGADGAVTGAASVARDVTERNRAEADRQALEHRLRQSERLESLGQLASGIAHDFNNLLSAIMNYAAFVAAETTEKPEVRADVQQIQSAAERAARLTRQLLTFARREPVQAQPLDLAAIVDDVRNLLSRSIEAHIELIIELAADLPAIVADRGQVEQVLLNLAINARDAMPGGGSLTITTSLAELDEAYCGAHPGARPGRYAELAVADTGTGMSAEVVSPHLRPLLHHQARGPGHRPGTVHRVRHHHRGRRQHQRRLRTRGRHHLPPVLSHRCLGRHPGRPRGRGPGHAAGHGERADDPGGRRRTRGAGRGRADPARPRLRHARGRQLRAGHHPGREPRAPAPADRLRHAPHVRRCPGRPHHRAQARGAGALHDRLRPGRITRRQRPSRQDPEALHGPDPAPSRPAGPERRMTAPSGATGGAWLVRGGRAAGEAVDEDVDEKLEALVGVGEGELVGRGAGPAAPVAGAGLSLLVIPLVSVVLAAVSEVALTES